MAAGYRTRSREISVTSQLNLDKSCTRISPFFLILDLRKLERNSEDCDEMVFKYYHGFGVGTWKLLTCQDGVREHIGRLHVPCQIYES